MMLLQSPPWQQQAQLPAKSGSARLLCLVAGGKEKGGWDGGKGWEGGKGKEKGGKGKVQTCF